MGGAVVVECDGDERVVDHRVNDFSFDPRSAATSGESLSVLGVARSLDCGSETGVRSASPR